MIKIFVDGSYDWNGVGGWGAVLIHPKKTLETSGFLVRKDLTHNKMEIEAAISALKLLKFPCKVEVFSDSQYMIFGADSKKWNLMGRAHNGDDRLKNAAYWKRLYDVAEPHTIQWTWVRGHNGDPNQEKSHTLAYKAMQKGKSTNA